MPFINQGDCFNLNKKIWKILGIDPLNNDSGYIYRFCTKLFLNSTIFLSMVLNTVNFYFLERQLDEYIEELLFYVAEFSVTFKIVAFIFLREEVAKIFETLDRDVFQPVTDKEFEIIKAAQMFIKRYWKIVLIVGSTSNMGHVILPFVRHLFLSTNLELPACNYAFIPEATKQSIIYPLYFYQSIGVISYFWYSVNIHTFMVGLMILLIAQLDILNDKLRNITNASILTEHRQDVHIYVRNVLKTPDENELIKKLNGAIVHFDEVSKFCSQIQRVFGVTLFVQFGIGSIIICTCLFRLIVPVNLEYFIFLTTYMSFTIVQILVSCWFGTCIIDKSNALSSALYDCDWTPRSRRFKTTLRIFVERTNKPLCIIAWKKFPLSLTTFTSIMNTAYSFFTLLRNVQSQE